MLRKIRSAWECATGTLGRVVLDLQTGARLTPSRFKRAARFAHEDEEGGAMVFAAITLFALVLFIMLVYMIGMTSGDRMQLQCSADAAAYSAALVEAEAVESISFLNDGMAFVYYALARYEVDAIVYGTLRLFSKHNEMPEVQARAGQFEQEARNRRGMGSWEVWDPVGGPSMNNPGATSSNFLKAGNYGNMRYGMSQIKLDYHWVTMGEGHYSFNERYKRARKNASRIEDGKRWLADIHWAERLIVAATPAMVRKTAIEIATANGAEAVGISDDVEQVFLVGQSGKAGFSNKKAPKNKPNPGDVDGDLADRYQLKANPIDGRDPRALPSWAGTPSGYSQTRICWNFRDWNHAMDPRYRGDSHQGYPTFSKGPTGHWHMVHAHALDFMDPILAQFFGPPPANMQWNKFGQFFPSGNHPHDHGHGIISGRDMDVHKCFMDPDIRVTETEQQDPDAPHHASARCPTCAAVQGGGQSPEITYNGSRAVRDVLQTAESDTNWKDGDGKAIPADSVPLRFTKGLPQPIKLTGYLLRAGITVATWRKSRNLSDIFKKVPTGLLAVASAQLGLRDKDGGVGIVTQDNGSALTFRYPDGTTRNVTLQGGSAPINLFLSGSPLEPGSGAIDGFRFGARLVPVRAERTWVDGPSSGLGKLLGSDKRWFRAAANGESADTPERLDDVTSGAGSELKKIIDVSSGAKNFAH